MNRDKTGPASTTPEGQAFLQRLREHAGTCSRLGHLVKRQRDLVSKEDTQALIGLLRDRRKLTDDLSTMYDGFGSLQQQWETTKHTLNHSDRQHAETLINAVRSTIQNVIATDDEDARLLEVRKQRVAESMQTIPQSSAVLSAYGAPGGHGGIAKVDQQS